MNQEVSSEQIFRLSSLALLGILFMSVTAIAQKKPVEIKPNQEKIESIYSQVRLVDEADMINSGGYSPSRLTVLGNRIEATNPQAPLK